MRIKWKDEDLGEYSGIPSIKECRYIKQQIGMLPNQFNAALDQADPEATAMIVAIMKARKGEDVDWTEIDGQFEDLVVDYNAAEKKAMKEAQKAAADDPKQRSAKLIGIDGGKNEDSPKSTSRSPRSRQASGNTSGSTPST